MNRPATPELVGLGSINVDLVIGTDRSAGIDLTHPEIGLTDDDIGGERAVAPDRIDRAITHLSTAAQPIASPGGSALNVVAGVAASGAPVTVGHVGVRGRRPPAPGIELDLGAWFGRLGIDDRLVGSVDGPPGVCLAITRGTERTLLTTGGANDRLGRWLAERHEDVVDHLRAARIVHVTSLAGLDDLDPLLAVLDEIRRPGGDPGERRPLVSCDPGAIWTAPDRPAAADAVLAHSDQLLVNRRELLALDGVDAVTDRWPAVGLVVEKGADRVELHRRGRATETVPNPEVLGEDRIVDDTGSGDAFAAGFLIGQLLDLAPSTGVELGMDLARLKLGFPGVTGIEHYASVWRRLAERHRERLAR
ncbi:MAG: PfkB family carbohydrate kinase [Actinomycetota bacterium]